MKLFTGETCGYGLHLKEHCNVKEVWCDHDMCRYDAVLDQPQNSDVMVGMSAADECLGQPGD